MAYALKERNLSIKHEIKACPSKVLKRLLFKAILPVMLLAYAVYLLAHAPQTAEYIRFNISHLNPDLWPIYLILIFAAYLILKDAISYITLRFLASVTALLFPTYIQIYSTGIVIRGIGYLPKETIVSAQTYSNLLEVIVKKSAYKKPNIIKRMIYAGRISIKRREKTMRLIVSFDTDLLNTPLHKISALVPTVGLKPQSAHDIMRRQYKSLANDEALDLL